MNDINAACGSSVTTTGNHSPSNADIGASSIADRLAKLDTLRDQNLITPEEYNSKRKNLINEI